MKANCIKCIHRCITKEQYLSKPPINMLGEEVEFNCLVLDNELEKLLQASCEDFEEETHE